MTTQEQKREAVKRMRALGIASGIIEDFEKNDNVQIFESAMGIGYWPDEDMKKVIADVQDRFGGLVYGGVKNTYLFDGDEKQTHVCLLYVSRHEEEWEDDNDLLKSGETFAYVHNITIPDFSEPGYIGIARTPAGGLRRTY